MLPCNFWNECNCKMFHYCVFLTNVERSTPLATVRFVESFFYCVRCHVLRDGCCWMLTLHVPKLSDISRISVVVHVSDHIVDSNCTWLSSVSVSCLFSIKANFEISTFSIVQNSYARGRHWFCNVCVQKKSTHSVSGISSLVWFLVIQLKPRLGYFKRLNVEIVKCLH